MKKKKKVVRRRRKPKTLRDLVRFFDREGWEIEFVARPLAVVAKPKKRA